MTNPNNAIGTNGAYGGRTSVDAFNDVLALFNGRGCLSGFVVSPDSGMTVSLGGDGTTRDVAIAEDNTGNKTTINNISGSPISVTIDAAPASNSRIDAIVAYVDNSPQGTSTDVDNPGACGLIVVKGNTASSPIPPSEAMIRTAITTDGSSGTTAYYVILGYVRVPNGTTDITANLISQGPLTTISVDAIQTNSITSAKLASGAVTSTKIDWTTVAGITTNTNGTAIKFGNGIMICFKTFASGDITTGGTYGDTQWTFPVSFVDIPTFVAMPTRGSGDYGMYLPKINALSTTSAQCIWLNMNNTIATNKSLFYSCHYAIGRWQ